MLHSSYLYQTSQKFSSHPVRVDVELSDGTGDLLHVVGQLVGGVAVPGGVPPGGHLVRVEAAQDEAEGREVEVGGVTGPSIQRKMRQMS